jgi:hypothetical protein
VLMSLMRFLDWESNYLVHPRTGKNLSINEMAALLKTDRTALTEKLDKLQEKGLVAAVKTGKGYPSHYIINSHIMFKGNKIKDLNDHERFNKDCPYNPPVAVKYNELRR